MTSQSFYAWQSWNSGTVTAAASVCGSAGSARANNAYGNGAVPRPVAALTPGKTWAEARRKADACARELLFSALDPQQRADFERSSRFEVTVGEHVYRISPHNSVERLEPGSGKVLATFCIHGSPRDDLPPHDVALTQKLLLESDELEFLRVANMTLISQGR
jgi:hypothetical protein